MPHFNKAHKKTISKGINRIHRIIQLYVIISSRDKVLNIDEYCKNFQVTERTLRRDIKVIKDLYPDMYILFNRNWQE
jgi:predicted DNA-binding transcriptional regulator YafY